MPKSVKTHLRAYVILKIFPMILHLGHSFEGGMGREKGKVENQGVLKRRKSRHDE
jgi:hypothetical protein